MAQQNSIHIPIRVVDNTGNDSESRNETATEDASTSNGREEMKEKAREDNYQIPEELIKLPLIARTVFSILFIFFVIIGATYFWAVSHDEAPTWVAPLMTFLWVVSGVGVLGLLYLMWRQFNLFCTDLTDWANGLLQGDLSSRMLIRSSRCPSEGLRMHVNKISEDYESLAKFEQQRFERQAERIEQKKYYLDVLYDVSSTINKSNNLEDLLQRFLHTLRKVVKAEAATVRLLDKENQMRLVASIGLSDEIIALEDTLPAPDCLCGKALSDASVMVNTNVTQCALTVGQNFFESDEDIEMLAIPLQYRGKTLGVYNLFVHRKDHDFLEGEHELLVSIGQHLGMAIEQAGVEEDARMLSIIEERTRMAHELHDSLAQTMASLRFKVRLMDDSLNQGDEEVIWHELEGLESTIDEAYAELRSLITHFRAPIDGKGVVRAVERVVGRFKLETGADTFFYHNWNLKTLSRDTEVEVIRIVQEALANIKKHANAKNVRILMTSTEEGHCSVLVEDDGVGLNDEWSEQNNETGDHLGLSIMNERAERINGEIQFESDGGEGTLLQLNFDVDANPVTLNTFKK
ncbi:histidine kinase [Cocleimonas sp. KMM 6892]|uniref:histidine kinase n=1 Tax=unclassified Cocleimonas TaxID=2639732 RepID=UPI002DBA154E|nr:MULTISPECIES: histidine kinase [unclassified Cocleimonas]MEB8433897.1 histidine kinase [Cocleimonas sp. KMM 6892]MEC4716708.1 histidine kinase [Cocleimonas sp. KMM 6895]MEC4746137.1 histidine kinase [Cocleimonas sp. KMM 6896]